MLVPSRRTGIVSVEVEDLEAKVAKIRAGTATKEESDEVAKAHIGVAISIARRYAGSNQTKADDYGSCAMFGIVYAIANADRMTDNNITPWIISQIKRHILDFINQDHTIHVPRSTIRLHQKQLKDTNIVRVQTFGLSNPAYKNWRTDEVNEFLTNSILDDEDAKIVKMRIEGYTDNEIADNIGCNRFHVYRKRRELEERYSELERA